MSDRTIYLPRVILCRFGELFLKQGNRSRFLGRLESNVNKTLAGTGLKVSSPHGRLIIKVPEGLCSTPEETEALLLDAGDRLSRVFGLVSLSIATRTAPSIEAMCETALVEAAKVLHRYDGKGEPSFKVDCRRGDKNFPMTSYEIAAKVGYHIIKALNLRVDVHNPDFSIGIELGKGTPPLVFADTRACPGGLPIGTAGRGLLLLSGGIDSPVAGWLAGKRGLSLDGIYFHSPPFVGEKTRDKILELARILGRSQAMDNVFVVPFTEIQKKLRESTKGDLSVILYRRMMMRIADRIADKTNAGLLITGENLSQVASQTVENMAIIDKAARHLVIRPLVTYDKMETVALARRLGTYETSTLPYDDCCSLFMPNNPAIAARIENVLACEVKLDVEAEADAVAERVDRVPVLV